ncbi:MAG: hypothetical protein CMH61_02245 [Nanoarchaeota archaeon]|nr:hypothetical protein [Nanoarchaeota archaeon]|tara:strand:- start:2077 stop:3300 length:1224 start_codon:yes stop_codon:yes gene_type:complete
MGSYWDVDKESLPRVFEDELWNGKRMVRAYIALDDLNRGPALGGCRIKIYPSAFEARKNAQELAHGMTYKSALADVPYGGGKSVIFADSRSEVHTNTTDPETLEDRVVLSEDGQMLLQSFAKMVNRLNGRYITAEDVGTGTDDMDYLSHFTDHVVGLSAHSGNPSPVTAFGVYQSLKASLKDWGISSFEGLRFALKGAGSVASYLVFGFPDEPIYNSVRAEFPGLIHLDPEVIFYHDKAGDRADKFKDRARELGLNKKLQRRSDERLFGTDDGDNRTGIDVFIPAAARHSAGTKYLSQLVESGCKIICGPENNQLTNPEIDAAALHDAGITWVPDYAANAGGLINVHFGHLARRQGTTFDHEAAFSKARDIGNTVSEILQRSKETGQNTRSISNAMAEERIKSASNG